LRAIDRIRERAREFPQLVLTERAGWIELKPPGADSFSVGLAEDDHGYTVYFEGWHERAQSEDEALDLFAMGLSDHARLKVTSRGTTDHCWTLETRDGDGWKRGSTTGLVFFPFWRRRKVRYLQNHIITLDGSAEGGNEAAEQRVEADEAG
jgi:hypothetical protein